MQLARTVAKQTTVRKHKKGLKVIRLAAEPDRLRQEDQIPFVAALGQQTRGHPR